MQMLAKAMLLTTLIGSIAGCTQPPVDDGNGLDALFEPLVDVVEAVVATQDPDAITATRVLVATYDAARGVE